MVFAFASSASAFTAYALTLTSMFSSFNNKPSFNSWASFHGKVYSASERDYRNSVFDANVERIYLHNMYSNSGWTMAVNKFADMTANEWRSVYSRPYNRSPTQKQKQKQSMALPSSALPSSVDWSSQGAVTPVKNQGKCASWAFSATGALEGAWFLSKGVLYNVSEQELIDCSSSLGNKGCDSGLIEYAFQYVIDNNLTTDALYPYTSTASACMAAGKPYAVSALSYIDVPANSELALTTFIALQPVSVLVEADQSAFQFYSGGVMTKACGTNLDHGVLAVGYGTNAHGQNYYKIKNSWGADWGMNGYMLLGRGAGFSAQGQCGIQMEPSFPVV
jgi:C1A family cysteine protease